MILLNLEQYVLDLEYSEEMNNKRILITLIIEHSLFCRNDIDKFMLQPEERTENKKY